MPLQTKALSIQEIGCTDLQLAEEELLVKKYLGYAQQMTNSQLAQFCIQMANRHLQNFNHLYHTVQQHTLEQQSQSEQQEWTKLQQQLQQDEAALQQEKNQMQ